MRFPPLREGTLIRRRMRFMMDVELASGKEITIHCPNSGTMKTMLDAGNRVLFSTSDNPKRKYAHTLEVVFDPAGVAINGNTMMTNRVVSEGLRRRLIQGVPAYHSFRPEVTFGDSRFDFCLELRGGGTYFLEAKNVTLKDGDVCRFPDAVTERGQKHLRTLMSCIDQGHGAGVLFFVGRADCASFGAARAIDPTYADLLEQASGHGVDILPHRVRITRHSMRIDVPIPWTRD